MTDPSLGFQSTSAMVGGSIGLSVGGGFALKHKKTNNVAVALFGDGALDEGIAYEALNIASLYALPVLFLCENNSKEGEAQTSRLATKELDRRAEGAEDPLRVGRRRRSGGGGARRSRPR